MRRLERWWAPLACALALVACDGASPGTDSGMPIEDGGTDRCAGRMVCSTAGTSCEGDSLVTCAADADGCLVQTRTDCGASGNVCSAAGATAACVDRCSLIPAADRCATDGARACEGSTLSSCAMDANGCLVLQRTDCAEAPGGACDASGSMPMCVLPADPCAAIPAEQRCSTAGTSCELDALVTCAPNAFGCLVVARTDCSARAGGSCSAAGGSAACEFTGDPCDGVAQCGTTASTRCDGPDLVECARDAFGCFVETRTSCTDAPFGFCDADATPAPGCSTAALDPCMGVEQCGTEPSRACAGEESLTVCEANAFGCFVTTTTSCTATSEVCSAESGAAMCVDPCSLIETCPASSFCDGNERVTCEANAAGCLVESARAACDDTCDLVEGAAACVETACPIAAPGFLDCTSGTVVGNTAAPAGSVLNPGNYGSCYTGTSYSGREQYWRFRSGLSGPADVRVVATRGSGSTEDFDLFVLAAGDGTTSCAPGTGLTCLGGSRGVTETETVSFRADPGQQAYFVYDIWSSTTATSDYTLEVICTPIVCGDGVLSTGEQCDDGNTTGGDGCGATCEREPGYLCAGAPSVCTFACGNGTLDTAAGETCDDGGTTDGDGCSGVCQTEPGFSCVGAGPSSCIAQAPNALCSGARTVTAATSFAAENTAGGGASPTGTVCGSAGGPTLYYDVTIPANTRVTATVTGGTGFDAVVKVLETCSSTSCISRTDATGSAGVETVTLDNGTGSPIRRIVAVNGWATGSIGTYGIAFAYTTIAAVTNGTCATATPITANTTINGEDARLGGPRPTGSGCGGGTGSTALYYSVTVPAGQRMRALTSLVGSGDLVLFTVADCSATTCTFQTDSAPEQITVDNTGTTPLTRIIGVRPYGATSNALYNISFTYTALPVCGNGVVDGTERCDDGGTTDGDGCSATCTVENDFQCAGTTPSVCTRAYTRSAIAGDCRDVSAATPILVGSDDSAAPRAALPFSFPFFGTTVTHYSVTSNGLLQVFATDAGTGSTSAFNVAIPSASAPNGFIAPFWDDLETSGGVRALVVDGRFVVEWTGRIFGASSSTLRFQAHVLASGVVEVHYCAAADASDRLTGSSATIGLENLTGTAGSQQSFNTAGAATVGSGYRFTP